MKRTAIGTTLFTGGILIDLVILATAALYLPNLDRWSTAYPSRLWFLIFAGTSKFTDGADGLGLGGYFLFGALLTAVGLVMLLREYAAKKEH